MATQTQTHVPHRLAPREGEMIDREDTFTFTFEGETYTAHPGDTIASALAAAGVKVFSRSFKYHRPRGLLCAAGHCPNCLVEVEEEGGDSQPNARACKTAVSPNMIVSAQNAWPSLDQDALSLTELGSRFLPVGFYYKTFIRPQRLWPLFEHTLRHVAGLGEIDPDARPAADFIKQYLHADVAVIGGGPAGLSAARVAAEQGARVVLFDDNPQLGGHARFAENGDGKLEVENLQSSIFNLQIYTGATVLGWWEDNWLTAVSGKTLYKIRAGAVVVATGAYEQPLIFDNNDLPGVMLGSAAQRLLNLYGVAPGRRAVIVTANEQGWRVAADLQQAGVTVVAVVDERLPGESDLVEKVTAGGTAVHWSHTILRAEGKGEVERAVIVPINQHRELSTGAAQTIPCDLIAVSVAWAPANGLLYQAGAEIEYDETHGEFLPQALPEGVFAAGRVAGTFDLETQLAEGKHAGRAAAAYAGYGDPPPVSEQAEIEAQKETEPRRTSTLIHVPGEKKQFVCYCEDVTNKDVKTAIAEGFNSIELLKRYSTISMGPCQGKMCSANTIHLCARTNGWTIAETGTTTSRPPMTPARFGALAGQNMEPVQYTPIHDWHVAHDAKMMVAGLWMRPEHYGDPTAEVKAVRERVGLIDVSTLGKMRLTGPGVPDLLMKLYTNKWRKLGVGRVRYGLMCNDEGIVLDDGVTARLGEEEYYTSTTSSGANRIYEWIEWWRQSGWGDGVHVTPLTDQFAAFNLAGPDARRVLASLTEADVGNEAFPYMHVRQLELAGVDCRVLRIGFTGELSYEIHCPAPYGRFLWETIMTAGEEHGIAPFGVEAQRVLRLEKAHLIVGQDTDALSDPFAAGMGWAVKLDKSDFLGHRSLSRIAEDGSPQKLTGFIVEQPDIVPEEGLQIVRPNPDHPMGLEIIGWVTSSRRSPTLGKTIGLCWLPASLAEQENAVFTIYRDDGLIQAAVHHGPFYDSNGDRLRM